MHTHVFLVPIKLDGFIKQLCTWQIENAGQTNHVSHVGVFGSEVGEATWLVWPTFTSWWTRYCASQLLCSIQQGSLEYCDEIAHPTSKVHLHRTASLICTDGRQNCTSSVMSTAAIPRFGGTGSTSKKHVTKNTTFSPNNKPITFPQGSQQLLRDDFVACDLRVQTTLTRCNADLYLYIGSLQGSWTRRLYHIYLELVPNLLIQGKSLAAISNLHGFLLLHRPSCLQVYQLHYRAPPRTELPDAVTGLWGTNHWLLLAKPWKCEDIITFVVKLQPSGSHGQLGSQLWVPQRCSLEMKETHYIYTTVSGLSSKISPNKRLPKVRADSDLQILRG